MEKRSDLETRRIQADLYEHVMKDLPETEQMFERFSDLLDAEILVGSNITCSCHRLFEGHLLDTDLTDDLQEKIIEFIRRGNCTCGAEVPSQFRLRKSSLRLVHAAAARQHVHILKLLHKYHCNMNAQTDMFKLTPILYTLKTSKFCEKTFEYLLSINVDVNRTCMPDNNSPLIEAVHKRRDKAVELLLKMPQLKLNHSNNKNETALLASVQGEVEKVFHLLLEAGADCNVKDRRGNGPLILAVVRGMIYVKPLIERGVDVNAKNDSGETALVYATHLDAAEIVTYLLENGADPSIAARDGTPPIVYAAIQGSTSIVETLVKYNCDINLKNTQGYGAVHVAAWNGYTDILNLLLKAGVNHDEQTGDKNTPLSLAAHGNFLPVVKILLPLGCNVNNIDKDSDTALLYATFNKNSEMVKTLLEYGADPNLLNNFQTSPLWNAVYKNDKESVKILLKQNVDMEIESKGINQHAHTDIAIPLYTEPHSPLYVAIDRNAMEVAFLLVSSGYNIYKERWLIAREFPPGVEDENKTYLSLLTNFVSTPPRLLTITRNYCRKVFGRQVHEKVATLEIPGNLKKYLTLEDLLS